MTDLRAAAQAVLDRWDSPKWEWVKQGPTAGLMAELRAALAQQAEPAQEPVAWAFRHSDGTYHDPSVTEHSAGMVPLYPPPPRQKPLTQEEIDHIDACIDK